MNNIAQNEGSGYFIKYRLTADCLCLGERTRGGIFRPCSTVFRYYGLVRALGARFGSEWAIHAVGRFVGDLPPRREILTYAPRDRVSGVSTIPLHVEYIPDAQADIFVVSNAVTRSWPPKFDISLGALTSKGFGHCTLKKTGYLPFGDPMEGQLCVRIPEHKAVLSQFNVEKVQSAVYGYLFKSTSIDGGVYVRSLFEGSRVKAPPQLLKRNGDNAR